jgi:hypothetical protein
MPREHRRLDAIDVNWEATRTVPTWGTDLAAGEVVELRPRESRLLWHFEVYDAGAPVPGAAVTIDATVVTVGRDAGEDTFTAGVLDALVPRGSRRIERELGKSGAVAINVTAIAGLAGAQEIRIFVEEDVEA